MSASAILLNVLCLIMVYGLNSTCFRAYLQGKKTGRNLQNLQPPPITEYLARGLRFETSGNFELYKCWGLIPFQALSNLRPLAIFWWRGFEFNARTVIRMLGNVTNLPVWANSLTMSLSGRGFCIFLPMASIPHPEVTRRGFSFFFSRLAQVDVRDGDPPRGLELRPVGHTPSPLHCVR